MKKELGVEFYSSSNPGPLGKPTAKKISNATGDLKNWDPTDPDSNNPWKNYNQEENKNVNTEINNTQTNSNRNNTQVNETNNQISKDTTNNEIVNEINTNIVYSNETQNDKVNEEIVYNEENVNMIL